MSDILCVTSRTLCRGNFLTRIENIAACHPAGIILREKDLPKAEYKILAEQVMKICEKNGVTCILHSFVDVALELHANAIHLPLPILRTMTQEEKAQFRSIGASCHSAEDAQEAQKLDCTYITAGHIFDTDCKKGLPGRGIPFLRDICDAVSVPVYAIGGIAPANIAKIRAGGASGACLMSALMVCEDVSELLCAMEEYQ